MAYSLTTSREWQLFKKHLIDTAQKSLYASVVLYELGYKAPMPANTGKTIFIPKHIAKNYVAALTEGNVLNPSANSAGFYSATLAQYGDARGYSDFLLSIVSVESMITNDIESMARFLGYKYDNLCRNVISGAGTWISPDGTTATAAIQSTTDLKQRFLFDANTTLAGKNAPKFGDGNWAGVFHPTGTHDLFVNTSGGSQLSKSNMAGVGGFLENTEMGAQKLVNATIGVLANVRILESTQSSRFVGEASGGMCDLAASSGYQAYVLAKDAFFVSDLENQRPEVFVEPPGSGGSSDPIHQKGTAGVKGTFVAGAMDTTNRVVRTAHGKTL